MLTALVACMLVATGPGSVDPASATVGVASREHAATPLERRDRDRVACTTLESRCAADLHQPRVDRPQAGIDVIPGIDLNPLDDLGDVVAAAAADAWTAAMMSIWASGLFVLRIVLTFSEAFLTPDLSSDGPGRDVYAFTLWMAGALATVLALVQLGMAAFRREGKGVARAVIGAAQFVVAYACWFGYCIVVVAACGSLSKALMGSLLSIHTWPDFDPMRGMSTEDVTDAGTATVLAFLGLFLWLAAIGHILVYLARAASLLVLAATGPMAAAGFVADATRSWFWKSLRWFHAAAFTPVLMVLVLGIGVQFSSGVSASLSDGAQRAVGTALPAVMLIMVSVVAPLALFKLLAFVDPGTPSGASFRQGMAAVGGIQGVMSGARDTGASSAATADGNGRSGGEQSAEVTTGDRFGRSAQGVLAQLGPIGQAAATGVGVMSRTGALAASLMSDQTNQAGIGQGTYGPDFSGIGGRGNASTPTPHAVHGTSGVHDSDEEDDSNLSHQPPNEWPHAGSPPMPPSTPPGAASTMSAPTPLPTDPTAGIPGHAGGRPGGPGPSVGAAGDGAAGATAIPPVA